MSTLALTAGDLLPEQKAAEVAINAGASGALLGLLKVPLPPLMAMLLEAFEAKGAEVVGWNHKAAAAGYRLGAVARGQRRRAVRTPSSRERSGDIRAWAKDQGIAVSERGRIPASVVEQYQAATTPA